EDDGEGPCGGGKSPCLVTALGGADHALICATQEGYAPAMLIKRTAGESRNLAHGLAQRLERVHLMCARATAHRVSLERELGCTVEPSILDGFGFPRARAEGGFHRSSSTRNCRKSLRAWCSRVQTVATGMPSARATSSPLAFSITIIVNT